MATTHVQHHGKVTLKLSVHANEDGDYKIRWFRNDKLIEAKCYYTDDWDDARETFIVMGKMAERHYK